MVLGLTPYCLDRATEIMSSTPGERRDVSLSNASIALRRINSQTVTPQRELLLVSEASAEELSRSGTISEYLPP